MTNAEEYTNEPNDGETISIGDRQRRAYLQGKLALAADGTTYVFVDSPEAVYFADKNGIANS